jgi:hypothetical protein
MHPLTRSSSYIGGSGGSAAAAAAAAAAWAAGTTPHPIVHASKAHLVADTLSVVVATTPSTELGLLSTHMHAVSIPN